MITFILKNDVVFKIPFQRRYQKIKFKKNIKVYGFDTETIDGKCRLIADSEGRYKIINSIKDITEFLTHKKYRNSCCVFFNLRYDFQAILKWFDDIDFYTDLLKNGRVIFIAPNGKIRIKMIPKKFLSYSKNKNCTKFFDIAQFYEGFSLKKASKEYLKKKKLDYDVKDIKEENLRDKKLIGYCINDAVLAKELAVLFIKRMKDIDIDYVDLFSSAFIAENFFRKTCYIPTINEIPEGAIQYAIESYRGGWFETFKRGFFKKVFVYDINSAYPDKIRNLIDVNKGLWIYKKKSIPKQAFYGYIYCQIDLYSPYYSPISKKLDYLNINPVGTFKKVITLGEYRYLQSIKQKLDYIDVKIFNGWYYIPAQILHPFREQIDYLYELKTQSKNDKSFYLVIKKILNSFYGKNWQKRKINNEIVTGNLFNPFYASEITSQTRLQIAYELDKVKDIEKTLVAIATDSIISTKKLNIKTSKKLGGFSLEGQGEMLSLMSGLYTIHFKNGKKRTRKRGFQYKELDFFDLLKKHPGQDKIPIESTHVISLGDIVQKTEKLTKNDLNRFVTEIKDLDLNGDSKRIWNKQIDSDFMLSKSQNSSPIILIE